MQQLKKLEQLLLGSGASFVGYSDVTGKTGYSFNNLHYAVTIGIRLSEAIIDEITDKPTFTYFHHYRTVNSLLDQIALRGVLFIQSIGFNAAAVPASQTVNDVDAPYSAIFPHKTAAVMSGLGCIGKNGLFIHKKYGPRVRLATVLTDMPVAAILFAKTGNLSHGHTSNTAIKPVESFVCGNTTNPETEQDKDFSYGNVTNSNTKLDKNFVCGNIINTDTEQGRNSISANTVNTVSEQNEDFVFGHNNNNVAAGTENREDQLGVTTSSAISEGLSLCIGCDRCVKACPAMALTGVQWHEGITRDEMVDAKACSDYMNSKFKHIGRGSVCGICIRVCPVHF